MRVLHAHANYVQDWDAAVSADIHYSTSAAGCMHVSDELFNSSWGFYFDNVLLPKNECSIFYSDKQQLY